MLKIINGRQKGKEHKLREGVELVIGRTEESDVRITGDRTISGTHCKITWYMRDAVQQAVVNDLSSKSGTFVGGDQIPIEGKMLKHGDSLQIGETLMEFLDHQPGIRGQIVRLFSTSTARPLQKIASLLMPRSLRRHSRDRH